MGDDQTKKWEIDDAEFERQCRAASLRGRDAFIEHVHATAVRFGEASNQLVLTLRGGLTLLVPTHLLQGVAGAPPELIAKVELPGRGNWLHWEELDADFTVQDVAAGSFGMRPWMLRLMEQGLLDEASRERQKVLAERNAYPDFVPEKE